MARDNSDLQVSLSGFVDLLVDCLTSQQHASASQNQICIDCGSISILVWIKIKLIAMKNTADQIRMKNGVYYNEKLTQLDQNKNRVD